MNNLNLKRIVLAREARGLNQTELAVKLGMTNANLCAIEQGTKKLTEQNLLKISEVTGFPISFFFQPGDIVAENLAFRKREHVTQKLMLPIAAQANIVRSHVQFLAKELGITPEHLPAVEVTDELTPAQIAKEVRRKWNLKFPVISSMVEMLEDHGIIVSSFPFITGRVDSRCMFTDDGQPIIFLNSQMLGDKQRFSLAFELAHLVMHTEFAVPLDRNISREANHFAAEFLMPEEEIRKDFKGEVSVAMLGELKRKWKVSMIALLYRADDLGFLTPNQKRYIINQFNKLQIRRREPIELDVPVEKPRLLRRWIAEYRDRNKLSTAQLAEALHLTTDEFIEVYS